MCLVVVIRKQSFVHPIVKVLLQFGRLEKKIKEIFFRHFFQMYDNAPNKLGIAITSLYSFIFISETTLIYLVLHFHLFE